MIKRYFDFLGEEETLKLLEANEKPLLPSIRVNTLKITPIELKHRLKAKGFHLEPLDWVPQGFKLLNDPLNIGSTHEYLQGYYYIQNVTSMLPALFLSPSSHEIVIDMCSAPGGKGTHLAQVMNNQGTLILIDRNAKRLPSLEMNVRRLGIINSIILNFDSIQLSKLKLKADKILLDAPCTGEGLIRIDKNRKKSKKLQNINKMSSIQKELLIAGLQCLKKNGKLLYSTCSIAPEENELVINDVLNKISGFEIISLPKNVGIRGYSEVYGKKIRTNLKLTRRFYPHLHGTIGFFICLIKKTQ